jgi:hypothetical protein
LCKHTNFISLYCPPSLFGCPQCQFLHPRSLSSWVLVRSHLANQNLERPNMEGGHERERCTCQPQTLNFNYL